MKKYFILIAFCIILAGCSKERIDTLSKNETNISGKDIVSANIGKTPGKLTLELDNGSKVIFEIKENILVHDVEIALEDYKDSSSDTVASFTIKINPFDIRDDIIITDPDDIELRKSVALYVVSDEINNSEKPKVFISDEFGISKGYYLREFTDGKKMWDINPVSSCMILEIENCSMFFNIGELRKHERESKGSLFKKTFKLKK